MSMSGIDEPKVAFYASSDMAADALSTVSLPMTTKRTTSHLVDVFDDPSVTRIVVAVPARSRVCLMLTGDADGDRVDVTGTLDAIFVSARHASITSTSVTGRQSLVTEHGSINVTDAGGQVVARSRCGSIHASFDANTRDASHLDLSSRDRTTYVASYGEGESDANLPDPIPAAGEDYRDDFRPEFRCGHDGFSLHDSA